MVPIIFFCDPAKDFYFLNKVIYSPMEFCSGSFLKDVIWKKNFMDWLWYCSWEENLLSDRFTGEKDYVGSTWTHWATYCDIKRENGSESFPQQPSDMLQQEAQRRHSHAGRIPFSCMNPQVCRLLDEPQTGVTCWGSWTECDRYNQDSRGLHVMLAKVLSFSLQDQLVCEFTASVLHHEMRTVFFNVSQHSQTSDAPGMSHQLPFVTFSP